MRHNAFALYCRGLRALQYFRHHPTDGSSLGMGDVNRTRVDYPRMTAGLPVQALPTSVTIAHIFPLHGNLASWANIERCTMENHQLRYKHRYLELRGFKNKSKDIVLSKQLQSKANCLLHYRGVFLCCGVFLSF